jgi:hypothetical protein
MFDFFLSLVVRDAAQSTLASQFPLISQERSRYACVTERARGHQCARVYVRDLARGCVGF